MPRDAPWITETCLGADDGIESFEARADAEAEACASPRLARTAVGAFGRREKGPTDDVAGIRRAAAAEARVLEDRRSIARASIARPPDRGGETRGGQSAAEVSASPRVTRLSAVTCAFPSPVK